MVYRVGLPVVVVAVTNYLVRVKSVVQVVQVGEEMAVMAQIHLPRMRRSTWVAVVVVTRVMHHRVAVVVVHILNHSFVTFRFLEGLCTVTLYRLVRAWRPWIFFRPLFCFPTK